MRKPTNIRKAEIARKKEDIKSSRKAAIESRQRATEIMNRQYKVFKDVNPKFQEEEELIKTGEYVRVYTFNDKEFVAPGCFNDLEFLRVLERANRGERMVISEKVVKRAEILDAETVLIEEPKIIIDDIPTYFG